MRQQFVTGPKSRFIRVVCRKCANEQIIYNKAATVVKCLQCGEVLAEPTGGEAFVKGRVVTTFT